MKKLDDLINKYSSKAFFLYSSLSEEDWENVNTAKEYLKKYFLTEQEYLAKWEKVQREIFDLDEGLASPAIFNKKLEFFIVLGGVLFTQDDFEQLQTCLKLIGEKSLVIVQNNVRNGIPILRMKYPIDITWRELMSGGFISTVLFEMFANEYFVFGESKIWGKYSANDSKYPLDFIGFASEKASIFKEQFKQSTEELEELKEWLPIEYHRFINSS